MKKDENANANADGSPSKKKFVFNAGGGDKKAEGGGTGKVQFNLSGDKSGDKSGDQQAKKPFSFNANNNNNQSSNTNTTVSTQNVSSRVKQGRLSDVLDLWQKDFEDHISKFSKQAAIIKQHELAMMRNVSQMTSLEKQVSDVTDAQRRVDNLIERLKVQQKDLNEAVTTLESSVEKDSKMINAQQMSYTQRERNQMYSDAESVAQELINLEDRLTRTIKDVNSQSSHQANSDLDKIVGVLDSQLRALTWVDSQLNTVEQQIRKIETEESRNSENPSWRSSYV